MALDNSEPRPAIGHFALKDNDGFLVADGRGDLTGDSDGLFREDTRILSRFTLTIGGKAPSLLSSDVSQDNVLFRAHLTNRRLPELGGRATPEGVVHVERARLLWEGRIYERIGLENYGRSAVPAALRFDFAADFADIFEVRGHARDRRGRMLPPALARDRVTLGYEGLDGVVRTCTIAFSQPPDRLEAEFAGIAVELAEHARLWLYLEIGPEQPATPCRERFRAALARARVSMRRKRRGGASVDSSARQFAAWIAKARADLALLATEFSTGPYPCAGIPWFTTPFGRDGIITALQVLWLDASYARGVLRYLASRQATETIPFQEAAPGKIMHETRGGEMAALREVPFGCYYGGVDTTPLFVMLAGAYARRTGDMTTIDALWPALEAAMAWIDGAGDSNGDGFLDYPAVPGPGLVNQGWKDSSDSIFHADGSVPQGPIALVEVQGFVFAARRAMAMLAERRGERDAAQRWRRRAKELRAAVEERFWMPEVGFYAIALDHAGAQCRVRGSNAGQLLYTQLPSQRRAALVAAQLLSGAFNDGWGIRTLAQDEPRFNPMSYHNGSVWPHDTALCAAGIAHYGDRTAAARLLSELFDASVHFGTRLPELYCGFPRRPGEPPVGYPVACLPQAWSSGSVFMLLQACLGLSIDAAERLVEIDRPELPADIDRLTIRNLAVADTTIALCFERVGGRVAVAPLARPPESVRVLVRA